MRAKHLRNIFLKHDDMCDIFLKQPFLTSQQAQITSLWPDVGLNRKHLVDRSNPEPKVDGRKIEKFLHHRSTIPWSLYCLEHILMMFIDLQHHSNHFYIRSLQAGCSTPGIRRAFRTEGPCRLPDEANLGGRTGKNRTWATLPHSVVEESTLPPGTTNFQVFAGRNCAGCVPSCQAMSRLVSEIIGQTIKRPTVVPWLNTG